MGFPTDLAALNETLLKLPQQKIAKAISAVLLCYLAYLCAQLTWLFVPQQANQASFMAEQHDAEQPLHDKSFDVAAIIRLNLFGVYNEQPKAVVAQVQDAPETTLRLTLTGTVASNDPQIAAAVIENNGKQETYGIGDKITGTRATLESVSHDRVLINQAGRIETLMLDGFKYSKATTRQANRANTHTNEQALATPDAPISAPYSPQIIDQRDNRELSESAKQLKDDINSDPGKIVDHLKIVPKRQDGEIIGYQLMPGKNPQFFNASGLKSGDIAIQMNGLDLTNPSEAAQALQALKQDTELSLLVERDGEITEILFSIE